MIVQILVFLVFMGIGIYFAFKKINKKDSKKEDIYLNEFNDGKILLPIDKRDFENFDDFKKVTEHLPTIKEQMENIDKDFENWNVNIKKKENDVENQ